MLWRRDVRMEFFKSAIFSNVQWLQRIGEFQVYGSKSFFGAGFTI